MQGGHSGGWQLYTVSLGAPLELWTMCAVHVKLHTGSMDHLQADGWALTGNMLHEGAEVHDMNNSSLKSHTDTAPLAEAV